MPYTVLADAVLLLHLAVVLFVIGGAVVVVLGNARGWRWVNGRGFRVLHLAMIAVVVVQAWLGRVCPLTTLESWLRVQGGERGYAEQSFVGHWVQSVLFYEAPPWVFVLAYTAFGALVLWGWWRFPPRARR